MAENKNKRFQAQHRGPVACIVDTERLDRAGRPLTVDWRMTFSQAQADADKLNATRGHYHRLSPAEQREKRDRAGERRKRQVSKRYWLPRRSRRGVSRASRKKIPVDPKYMRDL